MVIVTNSLLDYNYSRFMKEIMQEKIIPCGHCDKKFANSQSHNDFRTSHHRILKGVFEVLAFVPMTIENLVKSVARHLSQT